MEIESRIFYRDLLRQSRATTLADAEGFYDIVQTLELFGRKLTKNGTGLAHYAKPIGSFAGESVLAEVVPLQWPQYHVTFPMLFDQLRIARNDAVHQGTYARHISSHALDVAIVLEDALMSREGPVAHYMVRNVIEAETWQPVSYIRQQMLKNAFSYLPFYREGNWYFVSDANLARYLCDKKSDRDARMRETLEDAIARGGLHVALAKMVSADKNMSGLIKELSSEPILVVDKAQDDRLLGVITPADVL